MKKKILLLLILVVGLCTIKGVSASEDSMEEHYEAIPDVYIWKKDLTGQRVTKSHQMTKIVKKSNNQFVYCIEPGTPIDGTHLYTSHDKEQAYVANMKESEWQRIVLLAYYGYGYKDETTNHEDLKWYAVTQYMIWKTVPHGYDIYFSTSVYKNERIEKFTEEQKEMERLLEEHQKTPKFKETELTLLLGETKEIKDENKVLAHYQLESKTKNLQKNGNSLIVTATDTNPIEIKISKKDTQYNHPTIVYTHPESQDVIEVGSFNPISASYKINVIQVPVKLRKLDAETKSCQSKGTTSLKGAKYGLYTKDGTLLETLITNENCEATSSKILGIGEYYLQEIEAPNGYQLDSQKHEFTITSENKNTEKLITLYDKTKKKTMKVQKIEKNTGKKIFLSNIFFKIYDVIEKKYICETEDCLYKTNELGEFTTEGLYYSKYRLEEIEGPMNGYLWNKNPLEFEINEKSPEEINLYFENESVVGGIKIEKKNETNEPLPNVTFHLYAREDILDSEKKILYKKGSLVAVLTTNDMGFTSITGIPLGKYILKEEETKEGYILPDETFEIDLIYQDELTPVIYETLQIINYKVPQTLKNNNLNQAFLFISLGGIMLYDKKKYRPTSTC